MIVTNYSYQRHTTPHMYTNTTMYRGPPAWHYKNPVAQRFCRRFWGVFVHSTLPRQISRTALDLLLYSVTIQLTEGAAESSKHRECSGLRWEGIVLWKQQGWRQKNLQQELLIWLNVPVVKHSRKRYLTVIIGSLRQIYNRILFL